MSATEEAQKAVDLAIEQLALVSAQLKAAQKTLRRDWAQLKPRQRSEQSKHVKVLEAQEKALQEEIGLKEIEMSRLI